MIFLRGELMRITFDDGRVTVQEYYVHYTKKIGKLHILIRFKEYLDQKIEIYPFSKWQLSAPFLVKEYESEFSRRENFSDIYIGH